MTIEGATFSDLGFRAFGAEEFYFNSDASITQKDVHLNKSAEITHICDDPLVSISSTGGLILHHQYGSAHRDTLRQLERLKQRAWPLASISADRTIDWIPPKADIDPSIAVSLLRQVRVSFEIHDLESVAPRYGDSSAIPQQAASGAHVVAVGEAERERLARRLSRAFETEPLEDGWSHPAEDILAGVFAHERAAEWLTALCVGPARTSDAASTLACLARLHRPGDGTWRKELVRRALAIEDIELRDAAVQAAESWADRELGDILRHHRDRVSWLQDYIERVIRDQDW